MERIVIFLVVPLDHYLHCHIFFKIESIFLLNFTKMTYKRFLSIITLATSIFGLAACGEQADSFQNILPATGSRLKFIHAAPDVAGVDIYLNDKKFSGVNTTPPAAPNLLTYGNAFPLTAEYATYPAGATKVGVVIPSLNNAVGLTANVNLEDGKYYSVFATGVSPNYSAVALEDKFPAANGKISMYEY
jgi:hypothetical protein